MKISILTPDLSLNGLGRAYLLAKILQRKYDVEIVGPIFGKKIWKPITNDSSITYKSIIMKRTIKPYFQIKKILKKIDGDVIYASKPLFFSFGIALLKKLHINKPVILDIDDWELGFRKYHFKNRELISRFKFFVSSSIFFYDVNSYWNSLIFEKLINFADEITVSNTFLQEKFGGTLIYHARDTKNFNPDLFDKKQIIKKYEITRGKKVIMFFGTPRKHKGIDDLIKAISLIKNRDMVFIIVGINFEDKYCKDLVQTCKKLFKGHFKAFGLQPFESVPEFLAMADIVVIPQRKSFGTIGQIPAKVFDAMAMGKPIIATNVSDLPIILENCGWIIESGNVVQLSETIKHILDNPYKSQEMGIQARKKCIENYSWDIAEKILLKLFGKYE